MVIRPEGFGFFEIGPRFKFLTGPGQRRSDPKPAWDSVLVWFFPALLHAQLVGISEILPMMDGQPRQAIMSPGTYRGQVRKRQDFEAEPSKKSRNW